MNRSRIRLSRIVAFNWYGFRTIIEVKGLTLLCGETGTGKSALLDLIQFVLSAGSVKFNKAAAGESNARDLRSYCLCDSRTRYHDGQKRFLRRSGATIAALEFAWPSAPGAEPRRETWGIRVQYESPSAQPSYVRFYIPGRIERADLCDGKGDLLSEEIFRSNVKRELRGDAGFTSHRAFQEEMGVARHLHFDDVQMRKTLPKAIAFELDSDYQHFIREFILEASTPDVENTRRSLDALRQAELRVTQLHAQQQRLERIAKANADYQAALREREIFEHLRYALDHAESEEKYSRADVALANLRKKYAEDQAALSEATKMRDSSKTQLDAVRHIAGKLDPNLGQLEQLTNIEKEQSNEVKRLLGVGRTAREFLSGRAGEWEKWLRHAVALDVEIGITNEDVAILRNSDTAAALEANQALIGKFHSAWADSKDRLQPILNQITEIEPKLIRLDGKIAQLKERRTAATPLLDVLTAAGMKVYTLARVVEVTAVGEPWWGVIEALLGENRSALIVETAEDFAKAREHWRRMPAAEPIIHPDEIPDVTPVANALSALVETKHPIARRFIDWQLGEIAAVREDSDLETQPAAATPDGAVKTPPLRRWVTPEKDLTLGEEGVKRLLAMKEAERKTVAEQLSGFKRKRDDITLWMKNGKAAALDQNYNASDAGEIRRLPALRVEWERTKSTIDLVMTPELEARIESVRRLESELDAANQKIGELKALITGFQLQEGKLIEGLDVVKTELKDARSRMDENRAKLPSSILYEEIDTRLSAAKATSATWRVRLEQANLAKESWRDIADKAKGRRLQERNDLVMEHRDEYGDFDLEDDSNDRFDKRLEEISEHEVKRFESLAIERRADWEKRLQEDVLNRLSEKLRDARQTIDDFKRILNREIGGYRYVLSQRRDPLHSAMWKLIEQSDAGLKSGDELLDWKLQGEIEDAKQELMRALDNPEDTRATSLLDYRNYHRYDLDMIPIGFSDDTEGKISLQESGRSGSGGEGQAPFFVAVLAAFHRVYDRGQRGDQAHLGLVVMDEAFSKLSAGHIADCLALAEGFGLQLILAFPMDRLGTMVQHADSIIQCRLQKRIDAKGVPEEIINDVIYWERDLAETDLLS